LRIRRGWPQEQLALIAGTDARAIRRLEAGDDASFETLRSVAGAFGLHVHELMKESGTTASHSGQLRLRLAATYSPVISLCLPYAPALKGLMGSFALVLLAASTICLSPLLFKHHSRMPSGELLTPFVMPPTSVLAGMGFQHQPDVQGDTASAGVRLRRAIRIVKPVPDSVQSVPVQAQAGPAPPGIVGLNEGAPAKAVHPVQEVKAERQAPAGGIDFGWLASFSEPESAQPSARTSQHASLTASAGDAVRNAPQTEAEAAGLSSRGGQGGLGLVIEPLRRTGKGTAFLFSKVGSSLKRIF
jgi:transcriptional regulator with XRE-family HTH domain